MAAITASMVAELRAKTDAPMMECKKALTETAGDMKAAEELLRIKSGAKANKAASRVAAEGIVGSFISADGHKGALVEINCETDFVSKNEDFIAFAKAVAQMVAEQNIQDIDALSAAKLPSGQTVEEVRQALIMKLGENITLRRLVRAETSGKLTTYLHGTRIGVMVDSTGGDEQLGKDIAMHIAASKPVCVSKDQVSAELLETERKIFSAQAAESGKPADIIAKMVDGRIAKYLAEVTLMDWPRV